MTERPEYMQSSYIGHSFSAWCSTHEPAPGPRRIGLSCGIEKIIRREAALGLRRHGTARAADKQKL